MRFRLLVVVTAVAAILLAGCGGSDGDSDDAALSDGGAETSADDAGSDAADLPTVLITESDFAPVCRSTGIAEATAFSAGPGVHKVAVLGGEDPDYGLISVSLPDGWEADFEDLNEVQLVACANRVSATESELCEGYEDEGLEWSIQTYDATWEVTLRDATTAEVVAETTLEAAADGCPVVSFYSEGDPTPVADYATPDVDLEVFLKEYVDP